MLSLKDDAHPAAANFLNDLVFAEDLRDRIVDSQIALKRVGVDFFQHDRKFLSDDYDQKNIGGSVSLGKALGRSFRLTLKYSLEEIDVYDLSEDASEIIQEEEGARTKSAMSLSLLQSQYYS